MHTWFIKNNIPVYVIYEWPFTKSPLILVEKSQEISLWNENKQTKNNIVKKVNNIAKCIALLNIENKAKELWPNFDIETSCNGEYETIKNISINDSQDHFDSQLHPEHLS